MKRGERPDPTAGALFYLLVEGLGGGGGAGDGEGAGGVDVYGVYHDDAFGRVVGHAGVVDGVELARWHFDDHVVACACHIVLALEHGVAGIFFEWTQR